MRFTLVSFALIALARLLVPGVHGAPALASDHATSLALRQDTSLLAELLQQLLSLTQSLLSGSSSLAPVPDVQKMVQEADVLADGLLPRAPSSNATSPAAVNSSSTTTTTTTTSMMTSAGFATTVGSMSTVSASSKPLAVQSTSSSAALVAPSNTGTQSATSKSSTASPA